MATVTKWQRYKQPNLPELHVISIPGKPIVAFHPPSFTLFRVSPKAGSILQSYAAGYSVEDLTTLHNASPTDVSKLISYILQTIQTRTIHEASPDPATKYRRLGRLVLNISNACNLRCKYCYAKGGTYGKKTGLMSENTVRLALDRVADFFGAVDSVLFFGGEPCLNIQAIQAACEHWNTLHQTKRIPFLPALGMVSNGTIINAELIRLINTYKIHVTISLDGPPEVNDLLRTFINGEGTFHKVAHNILLLQEATKGAQPQKIEVTYTREHVRQGISTADLWKYFSQQFGINDIYIVPVSLPLGTPLCDELGLYDHPFLFKAVNDVLPTITASWSSDHPQQFGLIYDYVVRLAKRICPPSFCSVGTASLTIDVNGDIYPCYMLMEDELWMGNIQNPEVFSTPPCTTVAQRFLAHNKDSCLSCQCCWARAFCHLCFGAIRNITGDIWEISPYLCEGIKKAAERALVEIAEIQSDPARWRKFVDNALKYQPLECQDEPDRSA